ncbi:similar to Saccharomyces cerevisiae YFL025C BST1 GPI inositol deacylase of the ER that negatively regulates COPII vesicle formation [Maudiozyma barnettii]|uniref:GPI inositol-deacylase n=1 Tax=Maudiozyma barnettii TaxID=61262 RepID=A0A8H2VC04_9SACH|nr:Bst1p [Kazachstania barnettii]CAB4252468.1 similar to Saccharomyces cerevisiae YFL025C BST1 GPI inositol deacylase of the ER that negatively regulates COPII vesicle formation [Kazachstania barnettii]CAD1779203.1 similar to Saccharomyces cerevisiae YFL025C BST1 GPI inositol deacylase of the ER that negatively regulates COPII vesicle formation [Kazachstania barnettii]
MALLGSLTNMLRQSSSALRRNVFRNSNKSYQPTATNNNIPLQDLSNVEQYGENEDSLRLRRNDKWSKDLRPSRKFNAISIIGLLLILYVTTITFLKEFTGADVPQCRSIYMYPSYARIDGFSKQFTPLAQKYHLYLYREQDKDQEPMNNDHIQLNGVPVLFIPGNAGSFKQVRSIASACANLFFDSKDSINNPTTQNIDFFTADFNEDFTAFHGQTMLDQAEYLNDAIAYILSLYEQSIDGKTNTVPESVIIVAHSMGGIVARVMPTLQNHVSGSVNSIITLSSPHAAAPVTFDGDILKIYKRTNDFWRNQFDDKESFFSNNISLISITGAVQDNVLPADYAAVQDLLPIENGFTTYTTTIPGVWTPIDHLAIVWCKQLRLVISRLLLEMIDNTVPSKTKTLKERINISQRLLLSGFEQFYNNDLSEKSSHVYQPGESTIDADHFNLVASDKPFINTKSTDSLKNTEPYIIYIPKDLANKFEFILMTSGKKASLRLCKNSIQIECISLTEDLLTVPRSTLTTEYPADSSLEENNNPFRYYRIKHDQLTKYDFILLDNISNENFNDDDFVYASFSEVSQADKIDITQINMFLYGLQKNVKSDETITSIDLEFLQQSDALLSYNVNIKPEVESYNTLLFQPMIRQYIPTPSESKWYVNIITHNNLEVNMHNVAPFIPVNISEPHSLHLNVLLPPGASIKIEVTINWLLTIKMLFIRYRLAIGSLPIFFVALVLAMQFYHYSRTGKYENFSFTLSHILDKYSLVIFLSSLILTPVTNSNGIQHILYYLDPVKLNRPFILSSKNLFTNLYFLGIRNWAQAWIGLLFALMSLGFLWIISSSIVIVRYMVILATDKIWSSGVEKDDEFLKHRKLFDRKRILTCILLIIAVVFYVPYQLAYVIATLIQAGTCVRIVFHKRKFKSIRNREYSNLENYNISLLILFLIVAIINVPVIIVFLHNLSINYETTFRSHHNFIAVTPIILLVSTNSTFNMPTFPKKSFDWFITISIFGYLSYFCVIYGTRNLYFIHDIVNIACGWLFYGSTTHYMRRK